MPPPDSPGDHHAAADAFDVAVAGGGLVGAAAALGLARRGWHVLLVEPAEPTIRRGKLGADIRNVAVSPASRILLESLGVWSGLPAAAYRRMEVWEERGTRAMVFDAAEVGRGELGWMVENSPAVVALWDALRAAENVVIHAGRVADVTPAEGHVALILEGRGSARASLLLAADGADSPVRSRLGASVQIFDVGHVALATAVRTARPHQGGAYQRFLLDGPLALLPGTDPHVSSVVWSQPPEQAEERRELSDADFCRALEGAVQGRLGTVDAVDVRVAFPLRQQLAASFNPHPRVLLLGDAARVLHPLAGLGGNLGFEDVREMLAVADGLGGRGDPGAAGLWRAFDRRRRSRAQLMLRVMDSLRRVYARGDPLSQWLRNTGVGWLNQAAPVKRQIMVEAMGLGPVGRG